MRYIKTTLLILFYFIQTSCSHKGQFENSDQELEYHKSGKLKEVITYEEGDITNIQTYNEKGELIFLFQTGQESVISHKDSCLNFGESIWFEDHLPTRYLFRFNKLNRFKVNYDKGFNSYSGYEGKFFTNLQIQSFAEVGDSVDLSFIVPNPLGINKKLELIDTDNKEVIEKSYFLMSNNVIHCLYIPQKVGIKNLMIKATLSDYIGTMYQDSLLFKFNVVESIK